MRQKTSTIQTKNPGKKNKNLPVSGVLDCSSGVLQQFWCLAIFSGAKFWALLWTCQGLPLLSLVVNVYQSLVLEHEKPQFWCFLYCPYAWHCWQELLALLTVRIIHSQVKYLRLWALENNHWGKEYVYRADPDPAHPGVCRGKGGKGKGHSSSSAASIPLMAGDADLQLSPVICHVLVAGCCWL